jgi:hypothetical protein
LLAVCGVIQQEENLLVCKYRIVQTLKFVLIFWQTFFRAAKGTDNLGRGISALRGFRLIPSSLRKIWPSLKRLSIFSPSIRARAVLPIPPMPHKPVIIAPRSKFARILPSSLCGR